MSHKFVEIDFEYNGTKESHVNLVCCSLSLIVDKKKQEVREYWLNDGSDMAMLTHDLCDLDDNGFIFIAHNVVAEASSFISVGYIPYNFKWIDTFIEFRMLTNHNDKLNFGDHYIDGKVRKLHKPKPKWMQTEGPRKSGGKLTHSLSQAVFKFLGKKIDTEHKKEMRDIIISCDYDLIEKNREAIQKYCTSDIEYLYPMLMEMTQQYKKLRVPKEGLLEDMLWRGETSARTAVMERKGYPINYEAARNFSENVPYILRDIQEDINKLFPEINAFVWNKKTRKYVRKENNIKEWIKKEGLDGEWLLTDKKDLSLSLEAFKKHFDFRHDYPRDSFGAQMVRFLHTKQNLSGFLPPKKGGKNFWDSVGSDQIVRPWLNPYGSQSARYQPSATGFIPLKSAWMRTLIHPPKGKMIVSIDYRSQEFLIIARLANDLAMLEAYESGDPYLSFGLAAGAIPKGGTKKSHPIERQASKSTVLGLSYLMTKYGLAKKLTNDTGKIHTEDEAEEWVLLFNNTYYDAFIYKDQLLGDYQATGKIRLPDGWYMFGDNTNDRSASNCPIQGFGSAILRKAIQLTQDARIDFIMPLHDAGYIICDLNDWEVVDEFAHCMEVAFNFYFTEDQKRTKVGLDIEAWGDGLEIGEIFTDEFNTVKTEPIHIDERAEKEYLKFKKYFNSPDHDLL